MCHFVTNTREKNGGGNKAIQKVKCQNKVRLTFVKQNNQRQIFKQLNKTINAKYSNKLVNKPFKERKHANSIIKKKLTNQNPQLQMISTDDYLLEDSNKEGQLTIAHH